MFFRRSRKKGPEQPDQRAHYRIRLPEDDPLRIWLERPGCEPQEAYLQNLTIRGAGVTTSLTDDGVLSSEDVLGVTIQSTWDSWSIRTPAMVRGAKAGDEGTVDYSIQFINLGNLYSQMEDALGRYFNRRARQRVRPEMDRPLSAQLSSRGQVMWGTVYDLSTQGMGLVVDHVEAARLTVNADGTVRFQLPGPRKDLEGGVIIRQHRRLREQDMVGLEFDLADRDGFVTHEEMLSEYCAEREKRMNELEVSWEGEL